MYMYQTLLILTRLDIPLLQCQTILVHSLLFRVLKNGKQQKHKNKKTKSVARHDKFWKHIIYQLTNHNTKHDT